MTKYSSPGRRLHSTDSMVSARYRAHVVVGGDDGEAWLLGMQGKLAPLNWDLSGILVNPRQVEFAGAEENECLHGRESAIAEGPSIQTRSI